MAKHKSLFHQMTWSLEQQIRFGESKHMAKIHARKQARVAGCSPWGVAPEGVFDDTTLRDYFGVARQFSEYVKAQADITGTKVRTLDDAKAYASMYLQVCIIKGYSPSTIEKYRSALRKIFRDNTLAQDVKLARRSRDTITKGRGIKPSIAEKPAVKRWNPEKHGDFIDLARATGLRRSSLAKVRCGEVCRLGDGRLYVMSYRGKGGKTYCAMVPKSMEARVLAMIAGRDRNERILRKVPSAATPHQYRREYAQMLYNELLEAKKRGKWSQTRSEYCVKYGGMSPMYKCKDGRRYDREVMYEVSINLGHARLDVVATNYLS